MNATATAQKTFTKCAKCNGRGHLLAYSGIAGGVCFDCKGMKGRWETAAQIKARRDRAAAATGRARAQMERNLDAMAATHAVWEQRADLVAEVFGGITEAAMVSICANDELWCDDMMWRVAVANVRANMQAMGL